MNLEGKVAVVTGSGRGIGRAYAHALAQAGCAVVVNDVDADVAEATVIFVARNQWDLRARRFNPAFAATRNDQLDKGSLARRATPRSASFLSIA